MEYPAQAVPIAEAQTVEGATPGYFIRFAFNSTDLTAEYKAHLDRLAAVFKSATMAETCIKLMGHTDVVGSPAYNQTLSEGRAGVVQQYLFAAAGLAPDQIPGAIPV